MSCWAFSMRAMVSISNCSPAGVSDINVADVQRLVTRHKAHTSYEEVS